MSQYKLLEKLSSAFGPSGCEDNVADIIVAELSSVCDEVTRDKLGSVIAKISGSGGASTLVAASMDEASFMIMSVEDSGYLKLEPLCKIDPKALTARRVVVGDETKQKVGVVTSKPVHLQNDGDRKSAPDADKVFIDLGVSTKDDALKHAEKGSFAVFLNHYVEHDTFITGKALDSRAPVALVIEEAKRVAAAKKSGKTPSGDVYFVFATKEKAGMSSLPSATYGIRPDRILVVDFCVDDHLPKAKEHSAHAKLGDGPFVPLMDTGALYTNMPLHPEILAIAEKEGIPHQVGRGMNANSFGRANSAGRANLTADGITIAAISVPIKNPHTQNCIMNIADYQNTAKLLAAVVG